MWSLILVIATTEILLRLVLGLGNPVLVQADPKTGYRFQPNQNITRFFRRMEYNQYSQRSDPTTFNKPPNTFRILMTGDSILNGGNPTDQSETISEILESKLADQGTQNVEVLNASAGSWGIGNQLGYLLKFGLFESNVLIVEIGSHDLTQPTSTSSPVGQHPHFPVRKPRSALSEAWHRYAWPRLTIKFNQLATRLNITSSNRKKRTKSELDEQFQENLTDLQTIIELANRENIPAIMILIPEFQELLTPVNIHPYKADFLKQLKTMNIPILDFYKAWSSRPPEILQTYFHDGLHLTPVGNRAVADEIAQKLIAANYWQPQE